MSKIQVGVFSVLLGVSTLASASPGRLDDSGCHRDSQTQVYHCHEKTKQDHFLIGANLSSDLWAYDNGPANWFAGVGVSAEFASQFFGLYANYSFKPHLSGNTEYKLSGWSFGLKLGPLLSTPGIHPYVTVGYFNDRFNVEESSDEELSSYQLGIGVIKNFERFAIDARVLYRNPNEAEAMWNSYNAGGLNQHLGFEVIGYLRF